MFRNRGLLFSHKISEALQQEEKAVVRQSMVIYFQEHCRCCNVGIACRVLCSGMRLTHACILLSGVDTLDQRQVGPSADWSLAMAARETMLSKARHPQPVIFGRAFRIPKKIDFQTGPAGKRNTSRSPGLSESPEA